MMKEKKKKEHLLKTHQQAHVAVAVATVVVDAAGMHYVMDCPIVVADHTMVQAYSLFHVYI